MNRVAAVALFALAAAAFLLPAPEGLEEAKVSFEAYLNREDAELFQELAERFRARTGIRVELRLAPFDLFRERLLHEARRRPADLVLVPNDWAGALDHAGALAPFPAELLDRAAIPARFRGGMRSGDRMLGAPLLLEAPVLIRRADRVDRPPATVAELIEFCRAAPTDGPAPLLFDPRSPYLMAWLLECFGGALPPELLFLAGTLRNGRNEAALSAALELLRLPEGRTPRDLDYATAMNLFQRGDALLLIDGPWSFGALDRAGIPYAVSPLPARTAAVAPGGDAAESAGGWCSARCLALPARARGSEQALRFAAFLLSDEALERFARRGLCPAPALPASLLRPQAKAVLATAERATLVPNDPDIERYWSGAARFLAEALDGKEVPPAP